MNSNSKNRSLEFLGGLTPPLQLIQRDINRGNNLFLYKNYSRLLLAVGLQLGRRRDRKSISIIRNCLLGVSPVMNIRYCWSSGRRLPIPYMMDEEDALNLGLSMFFRVVRLRRESSYLKRCTLEFVDTFNGISSTLVRKSALHQVCVRYSGNVRFLNYDE